MQKVKLINFKLLKVLFLSYFFTYWFCKDHQTACKQRPFSLQKMPFKPLSNALLNPYKAPFKNRLCNYLITKNLRRLLNNSSLTHFPTFSLHILSIYFDEWWILGVRCWVVGVNGFYKVHCKSTHHHHPTFNPSYHQHSTFITHHPTSNTLPPTFNPTHHQHPTFITQHPSFPTPLIS